MRWDPEQYVRFADERNRAYFDLTARIEAAAPRHVVDLGCGPGTLTGTLAARWPQAFIEGIDSSPEMIAAAQHVGGVAFSVGDIAQWQPADDVDVIVSNAALQWVPEHPQALARWSAALPSGGWLAVQVPGNFDSPSHASMHELVESPRWAPQLREVMRLGDFVGPPESYAAVLLEAGLRADVWETTYLHVLQGQDPVLEWLRGTGLRPLLAELSPADAEEFSAELSEVLRRAYPRGPHGTVFPFRRIFAVGHKA